MKRVGTSVIIFIFFISFSTAASAFEISKTESMDHHKMWHKFKRGLINVMTSPVEVPKQIKAEYASESEEFGPKVASAVGGTFKGIAYFGGRLGSGLWDMVTFSLAVPEDYGPLMKPEYVIEK